MINKILCSIFYLVILSSNTYSQEFWNNSNGPFGGTSLDLIIEQENEIFATGNNGVFHSSDGGANWELRRIESLTWPVTSLAIKGNFLFAGTHQGLFRSIDEGLSWEMVKSGSIFKIAVHPVTQDIFVAEYYGVYYSTNNGLTWTDIKNNLPSSQIWAMGIIQTGEIFIGFDFSGLYKSTNYGLEWFRSDTGMTSSGVTAFVESNNGTLYAGRGGVYKSIDRGSNWTNVYSDPYGSLRSLESYQDSIIFAGLPGYLIKSTNYGNDWDTLYEANNYNNSIVSIEINSTGEIVLSVAEWGLIKSVNNGLTWDRIGLPITSIRQISLSPNNTLFSTTAWEGLYRSTNNGDSWEWIDHQVEWPIYSDVIVNDNAYVFCLGNERIIYRSFDNGTTWETSNFGIGINAKFFLNQHNLLFLYNINRQLYNTTDFGNNWILINSDFPGFSDYALDSFNNIYILSEDKIYKSLDDGISWNQINNNIPLGTFLNVISIDGNDNIYIGTGSVFIGNSSGVFYSNDYGLSFVEINTGLPDTTVLSMAINNDNIVYTALANEGVYSYNKFLNSWDPVDNRPYFKNVTSLLFDNDGFLYGGTENQSIIRSLETTVSIDEIVNSNFKYYLRQNYPNPFNPATKINYSLENSGYVELEIIDILGRRIALLVNEYQEKGYHSVSFNASNLTSGIYLYRIKSGKFVQTKKMILLK